MSFFPSLPDEAGVRHILKLNPAAGRALIEFHSASEVVGEHIAPGAHQRNVGLAIGETLGQALPAVHRAQFHRAAEQSDHDEQTSIRHLR